MQDMLEKVIIKNFFMRFLHLHDDKYGRVIMWIILNSLWPSDTIWRHRSGSTLVQVMACLLPDGTKPLPEPMLTYHQSGLVTFTCGHFRTKCSIYLSLIWVWKSIIQDHSCISQGPLSWIDVPSNIGYCLTTGDSHTFIHSWTYDITMGKSLHSKFTPLW